MPRTCECGCGRSLEGKRSHARYFESSCRVSVFKAKGKGSSTHEPEKALGSVPTKPDKAPKPRNGPPDYTAEDVQRGLQAVALALGNTRQATRMLEETGFRSIPFRTLDSWIRRGTHREEYRRLQEEMRDELNLRRSDDFESLSSAWNDLQWDVLRRLREKLPEAKVNELISAAKATPIASAISTDKARLYRNEATVIQKRPDAELEADIKRKLRELGFVYEGEAVEVKNEQLPEGGDGT